MDRPRKAQLEASVGRDGDRQTLYPATPHPGQVMAIVEAMDAQTEAIRDLTREVRAWRMGLNHDLD